jgi:tryptophan synthase alpha chain
MSHRVEKRFRELRKARRCGLIAYVTCGDPSVEATTEIALQLERAGADCIELGVPFSDPIADGPVIQAASQRALQGGTTIYDLFAIAERIRRSSEIPLVAFSYLNPILAYGVEKFASSAANAGIDSVLITDLPPEAGRDIQKTLHARALGLIFLAAPTSPQKRLKKIDEMSDGFVYYVSVTGVTGTRDALDPKLLDRLKKVRRILRKPLAVGFGISRHEHYRALSRQCDSVVVGSAIVRAIASGDPAGAPARASAVVRQILRGS